MVQEVITVLLIEDNPGDARLFREYLSEDNRANFSVVHADRLSAGLEGLAENEIDVILMDLGLPDSHGLDSFTQIREHAKDAPIVVVTGLDDEDIALRAVQKGAQDYLTKGQVNSVLLSRALRYAIERKQTEEEIKEYSVRLEILRLIDQAILLAQSPLEIAQATLANIRRGMSCRQASLLLFDFETQEAEILHVDPEQNARHRMGMRMPMKAMPSLENLFDGIVYGVRDIHSLNERSQLEQDFLSEGISSFISVPLIVQGDLLGALHLGGDNPDICSQEQVEIALEVANSISVALGQARLYAQIRAGRNQLQALTHRLVELQESEKRHIARELHDEIGQLLTGLKIVLELSTRLPADKVRPNIENAQLLVNDLISRLNNLSLDLRPAMLDDLGLLPALLWLFDRYDTNTGVQVIFQHSGLDGRRFSSEVETAAYRIVQEATTNVARHAGVNEAAVRLWIEQEVLYVQIEDEGAGFKPDPAMKEKTTLGLVGMRERAYALGGRASIESSLGSGTCIAAELPLNDHLERRKKPRSK